MYALRVVKTNAMISAYAIRSVPRSTPSQFATTVVSSGRRIAYTAANTKSAKPTPLCNASWT